MFDKKQKVKFLLENGTEVKSNLSGFQGIIVARADHINGCNRYYVSPTVDKDGKLPDSYWFDEAELVIVKKAKVRPKNNDRGGFASKTK